VEKVDYYLRMLSYTLTKKKKLANENKIVIIRKSVFIKEAQIESKDGLGKPGHLWEGILI